MGQFLPPKEQQFPATIADVKSRLRRVEHKMEVVNSKGSDTGGIEVTFSATLPDKAAVGDIWYKTSGNSVIAEYQCATAYASGAGVQGDWTSYTQDGSGITAGTVANTQMAPASIATANIQTAAVTNDALATDAVAGTNIQAAAVDLTHLDSTVTARAIGSNITTVSETEPTTPTPIDGDTWIEIDGDGNVTAIWTRNGTWVEATIAISTAGGVEITASMTEPTSPNDGDIWIDESSGNTVKQYDAATTTWNAYQFGSDAIATGAVTNTQINSSVTARSLGSPFVYRQSATPNTANNASNPPLLNDVWINTGNANSIYQMTAGTSASPTWTQNQFGGAAIANSAISGTQLASGAVGTSNIQSGAVGPTQIATATLGTAPVSVASGNSGSAVTSYTVTFNQVVPVGTNIIIGVGGYTTSTFSTNISDSAGNTYNYLGGRIASGEPVWLFQTVTTAAMTTSSTLTVTASVSQVMNIIAVKVPSSVGYDAIAVNSGTGTTHTCPTGTLSYAPEYVLAFDHLATNAPTWGGGATALTSTSGGGAGFFSAAYVAASSTASVTMTATEGTSTNWVMAVISVPPTTGIAGNQLSAGLPIAQPNISGGTITGSQFVATGTSGEFIGYDGQPTAGNMYISVSPTASSDKFGNPIPSGITVFGSGTGESITIAEQANGGYIGLFCSFNPPDLEYTPAYYPQIGGQSFGTGTTAEGTELHLASGGYSTGSSFQLTLNSDEYSHTSTSGIGNVTISTQNGSTGAVTPIFQVTENQVISVPPIYAAYGGTANSYEGWNTISTPSGWTVSGAGTTGVRYKKDTNNGVWVQVNLSYTSGTTSGGVLVGNLIAGYRPASTVSFPIRTYTATAPSNLEYVGIVYGSSPTPPSPRVAGDVYMNNMPAGSTNIAFCQWIPLD